MPSTAFNHFQQDIDRARAIVAHAHSLPHSTPAEQLLRGDLWRSAWMFGVGALDAYFCDAYTDIVAATIIAKSHHAALVLPEFFHDIRFPVRAILEPYANNINWRWRMVARKMMERENVLSLAMIQTLFNKFFRNGQKLFRDLLPTWIIHPASRRRVFGITAARLNALPANLRGSAVADAQARLEERFREIFQRRHDCIHNCGSPYWDRLAGGDELDRLAQQGLEALHTALPRPAPATLPLGPRGRSWAVNLTIAAAVLLGLLLAYPLVHPLIPWGHQPVPAPIGWGRARAGALVEDGNAQEYLRRLQAEADEWFKKRPEDATTLGRRIDEFREGCRQLIAAPHRPLSADDRTLLVERCRTWQEKLDEARQQLAAGGDVAAVRAEVDGIARRISDMLRQRADRASLISRVANLAGEKPPPCFADSYD